MKKSKVIEYLASYKDDEELLIAWWDKDTTGHELTDEQWKQVVSEVDEIDNAFQDITYLIDEAVSKIKGENK